ncbi:MAG: TetR/AcrR family transcriptional regulator [Acidimicrobiales bacterium]
MTAQDADSVEREPDVESDFTNGSKGERTRRTILEAAIVRFAREGYRATSLAAVARDAGLSPSGIYPYFANKEALFVAAVDEDAAGEIEDGLAGVGNDDLIGDWRHVIIGFLEALDGHPLARRVLAGLEPDFTVRLIGIPALDQLRKALAENLEGLQMRGDVRDDLNARAMASGFLTIWLSLLMSLVQTGSQPIDLLGEEVVAVFDAAMRPVARPHG